MANQRGFTLYESKDGWRWRLVHGSRIVAASGESFSSKRGAMRSVLALLKTLLGKHAPTIQVEQ
jgi:uncharacterized protein YegP (UPF0339 family)